MQKLSIKVAAHRLMEGNFIAFPTEAVWGLGCDPLNKQAWLDLLRIKRRPIQKGMILIAGSIDGFAGILSALPVDQVPKWIKGTHHSVALRVSQHPLVKSLCMPLEFIVPGALGGARNPSKIIDFYTGKTVRAS